MPKSKRLLSNDAQDLFSRVYKTPFPRLTIVHWRDEWAVEHVKSSRCVYARYRDICIADILGSSHIISIGCVYTSWRRHEFILDSNVVHSTTTIRSIICYLPVAVTPELGVSEDICSIINPL